MRYSLTPWFLLIVDGWLCEHSAFKSSQTLFSWFSLHCQGDLPKDLAILRTAVDHNQGNVGVYASVLRGGAIHQGQEVIIEWIFFNSANKSLFTGC